MMNPSDSLDLFADPAVDDFTCGFCQKMLSNGYNLLRHQQDFHNDNLDIPCTVANCPKKFLTYTQRERHVRQSHKIRCRGCDQRFTKEAELHEHTKKVHGGVTRTYNRRRSRLNKEEAAVAAATVAASSSSAASSPAASPSPSSPLSVSFSASLSSLTMKFSSASSSSSAAAAAAAASKLAIPRSEGPPSPVPVLAPLLTLTTAAAVSVESAIDFDAAEVPDLASLNYDNYNSSNGGIGSISNNGSNYNNNNNNNYSLDGLLDFSQDAFSFIDQIKPELLFTNNELLYGTTDNSSNSNSVMMATTQPMPMPMPSFSNDIFGAFIC